MRRIKLEVDGTEVEVELADTFFLRAKGLAFRESGKMLFKFSADTRSPVDMMLLSYPLHLYFIDSEKKVIDVQKAEPWSWDPRTWNVYRPEDSYRYLLESFEPLDLEPGDEIEF